jgi:hypothetical protein
MAAISRCKSALSDLSEPLVTFNVDFGESLGALPSEVCKSAFQLRPGRCQGCIAAGPEIPFELVQQCIKKHGSL